MRDFKANFSQNRRIFLEDGPEFPSFVEHVIGEYNRIFKFDSQPWK